MSNNDYTAASGDDRSSADPKTLLKNQGFCMGETATVVAAPGSIDPVIVAKPVMTDQGMWDPYGSIKINTTPRPLTNDVDY